VPSKTQGQEYDYKTVKNWYMFVCVACGLWGGLAIGLQTEYFTSNRYRPVQVCTCI
jgi:inorganic pyrophosphatase